jgi:hypothetical protein
MNRFPRLPIAAFLALGHPLVRGGTHLWGLRAGEKSSTGKGEMLNTHAAHIMNVWSGLWRCDCDESVCGIFGLWLHVV